MRHKILYIPLLSSFCCLHRKSKMKIFVAFAAVLIAVNAATDSEQWLEFKQKYGVKYRNLREDQKRFSIFQDNLRKIEAHNEKYEKGETTYYMGVTLYADVTHEEYTAMFDKNIDQSPKTNITSRVDISASDVPTEMDWRTLGVVSEVKTQGDCGGCWSFSATGAMESAYAIKTGNLVSLSEQQLIDCTREIGNHGCSGGTMHRAFTYATQYGVELETDYSYKAQDSTCAYDETKVVFKLSSYQTVQSGSEAALKAAVGTIGPVSVSIDADYFQLYAGGILDEPACTLTVTHGVLVVGYGTENGIPYWLVKNSWGSDWGEDGYVKMVRDKDDQCAIALYGVYPVI